MLVYAATIFLSAFLLFQVQPLIAKFILPWFGGSAAVWSAALLFFQLLLLAGYFYAHLLIRYLKPKQQLGVHAILLTLSLATLPIVPSAVFRVTGAGDPTGRILLLLTATVGLPYTLLSATSPLLQAWYLRTHKNAVPYRLFALSNFGSMIALVTYPTLVEPRLTLHHQAVIWSSAYAVFAAACVLAAWRSREGVDPIQTAAPADSPAPAMATKLLWIGLAACASVLLLAVTSHLTQNVAPIPLLWVVPLSLYLLSFILCFESDRLYSRIVFLPLLVGALGLFTYGIYMYEANIDIKLLIPALCAALFTCCMVCHGELARRRPHPRYLTQFYLMVSVGGALGGLFVALGSPRMFHDYWELPVAMAGITALLTCVLWKDVLAPTRARLAGSGIVFLVMGGCLLWVYRAQLPSLMHSKSFWLWVAGTGCAVAAAVVALHRASPALRTVSLRAAMVLVTLGFAGYLTRSEIKKEEGYVRSARNFYGVMHVRDDKPYDTVPAERVLVHGTIDHGAQLLQPGSERIPTSYFGRSSGIARAIRILHEAGPIRMGVLGLGAGVTASLANAGDTLHYYEINPLVLDIATHQFGFLPGCPAQKQVFMGDARLVLESLPDEHLDFLAMDAFSSDSVPIHLLTREAYKSYLRHLKPEGVLAIHISNRYLNLAPVVAQSMQEIGWNGRVIDDDGYDQPYYSGSTWVIMAHAAKFFDHQLFQAAEVTQLTPKPGFQAWTDDFSNIISILK